MTAPLTGNVNVKYTASGVGEVQRGLRLVGNEGAATAQKVGGSMRQIAGGVEAIARQGAITAGAMKGILVQGAEMAFMFGPGGAIVGAIAITGMAIFEHITGGIKAARDEINKFRSDLEKADFMAAATAQTARVTGDPRVLRQSGESNADFIGRRFGLQGTRSRIEELRGKIPKNILDQIGRGATFFSGNTPAVTAAANEMVGLLTNLARLKREAAEAAPVIGQLAATIVQQTKNTEEQEKQEDAAFKAAVARRAAEIARNPLKEDPLSLLRAGGPLGPQLMRTTATAPLTGGLEGHRAFGVRAANTILENITTPMGERLQEGFAETIGKSISVGMRAGFEAGSITDVLKAGGAAILSGIGGLLEQEGALWIKYGVIKTGLMAALTNPFTSGPAAIAAGALLIATGAAISSIYGGHSGSRSGGGVGGGGGSYGASQVIDRGIINPMGPLINGASQMRAAVPVSFTVIGTNDPSAQRDIVKLLRNAQTRGVI